MQSVVHSVQDTETASLLAELDQLEVVEAKELQEGVAFHAFRFMIPPAE